MNHRALPFLRVLTVLIGLYVLGFGIVGLILTWGMPLFDRGAHWALGLQTNPAFSLLSIGAGVVVTVGAILGGRAFQYLGLAGGLVFLLAGLAMLALLETRLNLLNFSLDNCIVSFVIGNVLLLAGLYGRSGTPEFAEAEERFRHGEGSRREAEQEQASDRPGPVESAETRHRR